MEAGDGGLGWEGVDVAAEAEGEVGVVFDVGGGCSAFVLIVSYFWVLSSFGVS